MKTNLISHFINNVINRALFPEDYKVYIRDRKGRFAKEPQVIKFYPIKRNLYHE